MMIRLTLSCCLSSLNWTSATSDTKEKPITDRNVEADERPADMIPASISVPTSLGITLKEAQMSTRCGSSKLGFKLSTEIETKFKNIRNITVQMAAMAPDRKVTCSLFAIRFRPACQGEMLTVMNQMMPMVTVYIMAPNVSLAPVPAMFP